MDGVGEPAQALFLDSEVVSVSFRSMSSLFCIYL